MNYYEKYLKYKNKYLNLRNFNFKGGAIKKKKGGNNLIIKAANPEIVEKIMNISLIPGTFNTLDNGADAFRVKILPKERKIIIINYDYFMRNLEIIDHFIENVDIIWIGCGSYEDVNDTSEDFFTGNSALVIKGSTCTIIGSDVISFELLNNEKVIYYQSTVGNSGVPYGYVETNLRYISTSCDKRFIYKTDYKSEDSKLDLYCLNKEDSNTHILKFKEILQRAIDVENKNSKNDKKDRPSPSESATLFDIGTKKIGNDGNEWIIKENKNGVKKWSKI